LRLPTRGLRLFALRFSIITSRPRNGKPKLAPKRKLRCVSNPTWQEAHLALGQCIYWMDQDYDRALEQFDIAAPFVTKRRRYRRLIRGDKTPAG
jgi:hypothetical protein